MREFQARRKMKKRLHSKWVLLLLAIVLVLVADGTWKVFQKERQSQTDLNRVSNEYNTLTARNTALSADISKLKTEQGVEDEIRSKYEVSKNGESVVVIVDKDSSTASSSQSADSLWQKFLNLFKRD